MAYIDDRPRFTSLIDLIDGGGAGRSGERFEGGGLLSILANALTRPYGYEDRLRDRKSDTAETITDVINEITESRLQGRRGFEPTNDQIAPPAAVSQIPVEGRTNLSVPGFSVPGKLRAGQLREAFGVQPPFRTDAIAQAIAQSQAMQDYPDMSMQPMEGVTTAMPPQNYESTAAQMQRAEFPMINEIADPVTEANLISMLYDDEIKRKQRGLGLGEMTGFEQARQMIMEQAPVLLENKTPQEQFEIIMLMKESRGL